MVLFISDENFNQDKFDHKHGTWLRNLLEATEKLEADEAPLENDIDPAVYLNVYRLDSSHDKEAPPPTVDGPYKTIAGQFDGEAEVTRWQEGALADRVIRYWQKLVNSNDGDDVTWSAHEDEEGYHLTACLPLALDYYVAAAGGAAADTVPPGLVCLDPRAALPISLAQLECHTDGFHEELANRLNARGCTAEALRQQRARRGAYCNTLITALQKDQELETEVFDFLETLHDVNFTSSTLSGAMEKALTLVPCIGCDLGKPISREDKTDPSVRYFAHTYPNGTEVDYLPSCPSKQDQAAAGDCSDYEKQWRQTYPHHALYHSEDDDGNGGALPTVQERANICNSTIIPPAVLLTQLGGGGVADEEVQALAKKMDVLGWVSGETSEEQETTSEADEASDACRVCLLFVVIFALLIIVVLLLFCCYRTAGAPQRGGGALVVDENIFAYTPAIAAERLDPGRVQRALVAAGFSAAFAATLAKQVASPAADRASLKWPLPGSPDFRALERLGLDFSAPETHALGVIRGILRKGLAVIKRREGGGRNLRGEPVLGTKELSLYNAEFQAAESAFLDLGLSPVGARKAARQVAGPVLDAEALNLTGLNELDVQRLEGELGLETGTDRARTDVPIEVGRVRKALRRLFGVDRGDPSRATDSDLRASPLLFATADEDFELAESLLRTAGASAACARKLAGDAAGPDLDATPLETQTLRALDIAVLRRELGLHATVDRAPEAMKLGLDATVDRAELDLGALREALRTRAVLAKRKGGKRKLKEELLFTTSQQDCRLAEAALVAAGMTSSGARKIAQDAAAPDLATERHLSAILSDDDMRILLQFLELDEVAEAGGVLTASVLRGAVRKAVGRHRGSGGAAGSPPLLTTFNLSYQTIENAFLSAGLTPGFARRLAQQTAAASVGGNEALVTPKTEADWRTLALLGLDFSQPECVGRVREFLQVMAAATISARCKDVVEMRVLSLDESQHRLQAAGFSEKMAGYVAAVIVRKAQQQGGARPGGAVEFLSGAERRELELCAESVEDRELFGIVGRAGLLPGFVYAGSRFPPQPDGKTDEWFAADDEIVIDLQAFALGAELGGAEVAHSVQGFEARRVGAERSPGNQAIALMPPRKDAYPDLRLGTLSSQRMRSGAPPSAVSDMMHLDDEQQTPTGTCGACVSWWQALVASCCGRSGRILQKGQWPPPEANFEEGDDREDAGKTPDGAISEDTQGEPGGAASGTDAVAESAKKGSKKSLGAAKKGTKKKSKAKIKSQTANEINVAFSSSVVVPAQIPQISSGMFPASERPPGEGLLNGDERATPADVDGAVLSSAPGSVSSAPGSGSSGSSRASGRTGGKKVGKTSKYRLGNKGTKNKLKAVGALSRGRSPPAEPVDPTSSAPASSTITSTAHAPAPPLPPGLIGQAIAALQDVGFDPQQAVLLSRKIAAVDAAELNERALTDGERAVAQKGLGGVNIPDLDELVEQLVAQKAVFFAEALSPESQAEAGAARDRGEPMSLLADRCADPVRGAAKRKWKLLANANKPKPKKNAAAG
ncbi:unnamed protein product [Amoebophrya sp. A120]|nr:unnamed protein product [Amoebophrya sp. A120]|eukprot:GSA120T00003279001.1